MNYNNLQKIVIELKEKYKNVYFDIEYSKEDDFYSVNISDATIAHNNEFKEFIGKKMYETYQTGEKFNAFFYYDSQLEEKMKKIDNISSVVLPELNNYIKNTNYQFYKKKSLVKKYFTTVSEISSSNFLDLKNDSTKNIKYQFCQKESLIKDSISINSINQNSLAA